MTSLRTTARDDQQQAAEREAHWFLTEYAAAAGVPPTLGRPSPWLADQLQHLLAASAARTLRRCSHLRGQPAVAFACAWRPDRLYCLRCLADELRRVRSNPENDTCDRCRQRSQILHPDLVQIGSLVYTYAACPACLDDVRGAAA